MFPKLASKSKHALAAALLTRRSWKDNKFSGTALLGLPLTVPDFGCLIKGLDVHNSKGDQVALMFVNDCVQRRAEALGGVSAVRALSAKLFE